ncbi:MAG: hypothetical protein JRC77_03115 [Deltaproteobacteria bacterium]|nr:hypothetical protein [Deltaproteobacteria bacterium]
MQTLFLIVLMASELCYYLLVAQTGIIESFGSDLSKVFTLPLGGAIGSLIAHRNFGPLNTTRRKIAFLLVAQTLLSLTYPNFNLITLFLLGLTVGALAPLFIYLFSKDEILPLMIALICAYGTGTALFTSPPEGRGTIAVLLSLLALAAVGGLRRDEKAAETEPHTRLQLTPCGAAVLFLWVALDSSLFEILSRHDSMSIWRGEFWPFIILFHTLGLLTAYVVRNRFKYHHSAIALLFGLSYALLFFEQDMLLSMVYPFVISYYNFFLLRLLVSIRSLQLLGVCMLGAGWIASGLGLMVALNHLSLIPVAVLFIGFTISLLSEGAVTFGRQKKAPVDKKIVLRHGKWQVE